MTAWCRPIGCAWSVTFCMITFTSLSGKSTAFQRLTVPFSLACALKRKPCSSRTSTMMLSCFVTAPTMEANFKWMTILSHCKMYDSTSSGKNPGGLCQVHPSITIMLQASSSFSQRARMKMRLMVQMNFLGVRAMAQHTSLANTLSPRTYKEKIATTRNSNTHASPNTWQAPANARPRASKMENRYNLSLKLICLGGGGLKAGFYFLTSSSASLTAPF
mmetsp:Transcript_30738/g.71826  ORF Transcript_30738/g.71826 Transcript_30738/m.71826 type:complete len:218 (+) Transcript_30738:154-807(+)